MRGIFESCAPILLPTRAIFEPMRASCQPHFVETMAVLSKVKVEGGNKAASRPRNFTDDEDVWLACASAKRRWIRSLVPVKRWESSGRKFFVLLKAFVTTMVV